MNCWVLASISLALVFCMSDANPSLKSFPAELDQSWPFEAVPTERTLRKGEGEDGAGNAAQPRVSGQHQPESEGIIKKNLENLKAVENQYIKTLSSYDKFKLELAMNEARYLLKELKALQNGINSKKAKTWGTGGIRGAVEQDGASGGQCPSSHPFVYYEGKHCCQHMYEKDDSDDHTGKCDGSVIGFDSVCCKQNPDNKKAHTTCSQPPCSNYEGKNGDTSGKCRSMTKSKCKKVEFKGGIYTANSVGCKNTCKQLDSGK